MRQLSASISSSLDLERRRSSIKKLTESVTETVKPETPLGWIAFISSLSTAILVHEIRLQTKLTCPPLVYAQKDSPVINEVKHQLAKRKQGNDFLTRDIKPSLLVGTRGVISSTAAYVLHGPSKRPAHLHFREIVRMHDGANIALDWEMAIPDQSSYSSSLNTRPTEQQLKANILYGPIDKPVVIILHGINNDTGFGYMKSLMRSVADKGWIACGFNFRGCGGQKLSTPRGYSAAYTGDIRTVVRKIEARLKKKLIPMQVGDNEKPYDTDIPVFLVGNSLGANLITKYLGEEGFSQTLPRCVKGGVSLGNPLEIHSRNVSFPFNILLAAGVKKTVLQSWKAFKDMSNCIHFGKAMRNVLTSSTIGQLDDAIAPILIRNDPVHPFTNRIGYTDGEEYWHDASSNRYISHVNVPLLKLSAQDDFLVVTPALQSLSRCLENPNVLVVKTKCGGHLGWMESPLEGFGVGSSWADTAMVDFIDAVMEMNKTSLPEKSTVSAVDIVENLYASRNLKSKL